MKIIKLQSENIKRLVAIEIVPDGSVVEITGKNGQGKTAVLDSIWWALGGTASHQKKPIRKGQKKARIMLDLGEVVVHREFKLTENEAGEHITTKLIVENGDGARFPSPQKMIDGFLDALTFDPMAFAEASPKQQYDILKAFVSDVDFDAEAAANDEDYEARTEANREAKAARALAENIDVPFPAPTEKVDITAIAKEIELATEENAKLHEASRRRTRIESQCDSLSREIDEADKRIADLAVKLKDEKVALKARTAELSEHTTALSSMSQIPTVDLAPLNDKMSNAHAFNERLTHEARADEAGARSEALTKSMDERYKRIQEVIESSDMPVAGLSLAHGEVTLNGLPFNQASESDILRTSCAIAMSKNSELRVLLVRNGSALDSERMKLLGELAEANDYQVWIERVDESGKVGFVIEDGALKQED